MFAKLGSDYKKPDATTVISHENWQEIVYPLPVGDLLFVGRSAQKLLGRYGVHTIGELSKCSEEMLETLMGKMGSQLYRYANGLDDSPVRGAADREPIKSVGNSTTFRRDLTRWDEVQSGISLLSDSVAMRLRRYGLYCGGVQVGIKNSRFQVFSRQTTLDHSTHLMREINDTALRLAKDLWKAPDPIRLLSVTALHLTEEAQSYRQLDLLGTDDTQQEKQEAVESAMDALRKNSAAASFPTAPPKITSAAKNRTRLKSVADFRARRREMILIANSDDMCVEIYSSHSARVAAALRAARHEAECSPTQKGDGQVRLPF